MKQFDNKTVYITGGSSGIGLAVARQFAGLGSHVCLFARRKAILDQAVNEIIRLRKTSDQRIGGIPLDVSNSSMVQSAIEQAEVECGVPDVLVNSAGRALPDYVDNISHEQFDETMKSNVYGIWNMMQAVLPAMKKRGGHIVNVSSIAGFLGVYGYSDYCTSKFAVIGMSEALRCELKPFGIHVSVLCPPDTDTPGFAEENRTKPAETRAISGNAKLLSADNVARSLVNGISKNKFMIIPGFDGKMIYLVKRLLPGLVGWIMDRTVAKTQQAASI